MTTTEARYVATPDGLLDTHTGELIVPAATPAQVAPVELYPVDEAMADEVAVLEPVVPADELPPVAPELPFLPPLGADHMTRGGDRELLRDEYLHIIEHFITNQPRSLQAALGPSEIGTSCGRRLGYHYLGQQVTNDEGAKWLPFVGTAVHAMLERALQAFNDSQTVDRFYLEERVAVGVVDGKVVTGHFDVYDRVACGTVDWKIVGKTTLTKVRRHGPGAKYRAQAHLYGRGLVDRGLPVDHVGVMFLPRNEVNLRAGYWWHEPYDEQLAEQALLRADGIAKSARLLGPALLPMLPTDDDYCTGCPFLSGAQATALSSGQAVDLAAGCPGHRPDASAPTSARSSGPATANDVLMGRRSA